MPTKPDERAEDRERDRDKDRRSRKVKVSKPKSGSLKEHRHSADRPAGERELTDQSASERGSVAGSASTTSTSRRRVSTQPDKPTARQSSLVSSMEGGSSRISLPYPAFSKAHSREAVSSKEALDTKDGNNLQSRESLDNAEERPRISRKKSDRSKEQDEAKIPPSPPLTAEDELSLLEERRKKLAKESGSGTRSKSDDIARDSRKSSVRVSSHGTLRDSKRPGRTGTSPRRTASHNSVRSKGYRYRPQQPLNMDDYEVDNDDNNKNNNNSSLASQSRSTSPISRQTDSVTKPTVASSVDSNATKRAPFQVQTQTPAGNRQERGDYGPSRSNTPQADPYQPRAVHEIPIFGPNPTSLPSVHHQQAPPPPPPPPMMMQMQGQPPRVDYLMQCGGLSHTVPKNYLDVIDPKIDRPFTVGDLPDATLMATQVQRFFQPFSDLLDSFTRVMEKNGSVAVATGYRSIARRLLDRLEAVFARDISSEICECAMCEHHFPPDQDDFTGISWGEILEFVSGRRELPPWPPIVLAGADPDSESIGLGILETPMQKLDIDVPEEYREHYIRQSKKTKSVVDRWLAGQAAAPEAPDEADDDTLTFAMLTRLDEIQRPYFKKLLGMADTRPPSVHPAAERSRTPISATPTPLISRTSFALQRLYRLSNPPRPPECVCYLVCHPEMHNILATLAAVSDHEWDILTSGRFDGFLWSGADDQAPSSIPSRGPTPSQSGRTSRGPTPGPRSSTPAALGAAGPSGAPVALDEETEIAALGEVERDIYLGMEALEDAFESLHQRAEAIRATMRIRSAGLSMAQAARRGIPGDTIEARLGTPASQMGTPARGQWDGNGAGGEYDMGHQNGNDDGVSVFGADWKSELAPDDSASNISGVRKFRRKKRVEERRTPAPIEEEDEDYAHERAKPRDKHGRKR